MENIKDGLMITTLTSVAFLFILLTIIQTLNTINNEFITIGASILGATVLAVAVIIRRQNKL